MTIRSKWAPSLILSEVKNGDEWPWASELDKLWEVHPDQMLALLQDVRLRGIVVPVQINQEEGSLRVIDGHHRIAVAVALQISVPVEIVHLDE